MAKIPNLWPAETVSVETISPLAILRIQADNLTRMTQGLLEGDVVTSSYAVQVQHSFDVVAPALNGYRHRILTVMHDKSLIYPVFFSTGEVEEEADIQVSSIALGAYSEVEFLKMLSNALQSGYVLSVVNSLIARSNEALAETVATAPKELQPA